MATNFSFPEMTPAKIAEELYNFNIAPTANLRAEDIANPPPDLLPNVLSLFLQSFAGDAPDQQLGFEALQGLDNPELHISAIGVTALLRRARAFLETIQFRDINLRDLLRPDPRRVAHILSAIINYLYFRQDKLALLVPVAEEFAGCDERHAELKARIAEHHKAIEDHQRKEQMEEPVVQQLEVEVNGLKQKIQEYNKQQMALRAKAKAIEEKKEAVVSKITQADFELVKQTQENSMLLSKIVQSPEKLQRALEEKKAARVDLKNLEKMALQNVQEKRNTLEIYSKAYAKLLKHSTKISDLQDQTIGTKATEKEVKALKATISDQSLEMKALENKAAEWQRKVQETEDRLKAKEKERDQRIGDNKRKMAMLKSEVESELKCLKDREMKVEEKIAKATDLCYQADSVAVAAKKKQDEIYAKIERVCQAGNQYMDTIDHSIEKVQIAVEEVGRISSDQSVA